MSTSPDLCIIGAGALGIDLALHARRLGASVVLAERARDEPGDARTLAIHAAALAASAARAEDMRRAPSLGVGASEFKLSAKQLAERARGIAEQQGRARAPEILTAAGITVIRGAVAFADPRSVRIGDVTIKPRSVVLALGGDAVVPDIPGLAETEFFTPDTIFDNQRKLTHLVIIGGDPFAIEQAQVQRRLGAEVTLVPQGPLLNGFDAECVAILAAVLAEEGIAIERDAKVSQINKRSQGIGVDIAQADGTVESLDASHVLVSAGRRVDFGSLDLGKTKLKLGDDGAPVLRGALGATSARHIRLVGSAAGQAGWAEAHAHGRTVIDSILGQGSRPISLPRLVETQPPLAQVGRLVERVGKPAPGEMLLRESFAENDRAAALGVERGLAKVSVSANGEIARAAVVGAFAPEFVAVLTLGMDKRIGIGDFARLPLPVPSLFSILSRLGETYSAQKVVSTWKSRSNSLRRIVQGPFRG